MRWHVVISILLWLAMLAVCVLHTLDGLCGFPPHLHWIPVVTGQVLFSFATLVSFAIYRTLASNQPDKEDE
jgi:hypothetical protein